MNDKESISAMQPLKEVTTDRDYFQEMLNALELGNVDDLRLAVSRLSITEINRCFTHAAEAEFSIPVDSLPLSVQEDLCTKDAINIGAVHYAAKNGDKLCLEVLLEGGADPNMKDSFGQTPLHILPKSGWRNTDKDFAGCLNVLLEHETTDRNRLDLSKSTPLSRAEEFQWTYMIESLKSHDSYPSDILLKLLFENKLEDFRSTLKTKTDSANDISTIVNESHGGYTLLQYACRLGKSDFVLELLNAKASPTLKYDMNILSPVMWATKYGYHQILQQLVKNMTKENLQDGSLRECNDQKETPLHFVVKCENSHPNSNCNYLKCLQILLDKKAYTDIDAKDADDNTPLHHAAICKDLTSFSILLKNEANSTLTNVIGLTPLHYVSKEGMITILDDCVEFSRNKKLIDKDFWIDLNYHMMNIKFDGTEATECPPGNGSSQHWYPQKYSTATELNFLNSLTEIHRDKDILHHPILDIFIYLKWQNIKKCFYFNFAAHIIFLALLLTYICIYHSSLPTPESINETTDESQPESLRVVLSVILLLSLVVREAVQLFMIGCWTDYCLDVKNIIEVVTASLTVVFLFSPFSDDVKMGMAAWLILFSLLEFILHLGRLPTFSVYIAMFNAVAWNFFKFICLFSVIIVAFSLSFYLMFQINENFRTFPESLLKTIVMTTGEVEYSDLPVSTFPVASHILMVFFVFLILLVLVNLLNGLAISDIQAIQKEAEVISCMSLVDRMAQCEKAFYCSKNRNPFKKILDWLFDTTLTFKTCLPGHKLRIYISHEYALYSHGFGTEDLSICKCHAYKLQDKHIGALKAIVMEKRLQYNHQHNSSSEKKTVTLVDH